MRSHCSQTGELGGVEVPEPIELGGRQCQVAAGAAAVLEPCRTRDADAAGRQLVAGQQPGLEMLGRSSARRVVLEQLLIERSLLADQGCLERAPLCQERSGLSGELDEALLQRLEALEELELLVHECGQPIGQVTDLDVHGLELSSCTRGAREPCLDLGLALRQLAHLDLECLKGDGQRCSLGLEQLSRSLDLGELLSEGSQRPASGERACDSARGRPARCRD